MSEAGKLPKVWSVSELTAEIRGALEGHFPSVDLEAEMSDFRVYPSGHAYFTLKDEGAVLSGVIFRGFLEASMKADLLLAQKVRDGKLTGAKVKVRGGVTVYPSRGNYQLNCRRMKLAGEGELMRRYLELKARLKAEGLFDSDKKRPLPKMPRRIGLVTSERGAVVHDMCRVLIRRFPALEITVFPCSVQGDGAASTIIAGIEYFNTAAVDLIIVARGGGSFEDLFCFNDEALVRAVASAQKPIISAVGHETDFTLCDFAADYRAGTPSIAAEIAVPVLADLRAQLAEYSLRMVSAVRGKGEYFAQRLDHLGDSLGNALRFRLQREEARFQRWSEKLEVLSPYRTLERGYSLTTTAAGAVVQDASTLAVGDTLVTRFARGEIRSSVQSFAD